MLRLIVIAFAVLCLMGSSSLALAGEPMSAVEDTSAKDETKGKTKAQKGKKPADPMSAVEDTSAKKDETKGKTKAQKGKKPADPMSAVEDTSAK
jgi:Na+-transporting methylmalonyl-CoA/oxaloacetate decarboxylase gamma subunit